MLLVAGRLQAAAVSSMEELVDPDRESYLPAASSQVARRLFLAIA